MVQVKGLLSQEEEEEGFNSGPATSQGEQQLHLEARALLCKIVSHVLNDSYMYTMTLNTSHALASYLVRLRVIKNYTT